MRRAAVLLVSLVTCVGGGARFAESGTRHEILMRAVAFDPNEVVVRVGDTVSWRNVDIVRHNALRPDLFDTGELKPGDRYDWVVRDTGSYVYKCSIHQRMRGRIRVQP